MAALARLQTVGCTNPVLDLYTTVNGVLSDVYAVSFQIYDKTNGTPVQVYPATPGDRVPLDVTHPCPTGARLSAGHYAATWTVPGDANIGTFQVKWYFQLTNSTPEQTYIEEFEVLPEVFAQPFSPVENYCSIADMRDEGVPTSVTDAWLAKRIVLASRFVEAATRRFFYPKPMTFRMDGTGGPKMFFSDPIVGIEYVKFEISPLYPEDFTIVETDIMRVYNRHLVWGLTEPDDRNNPKIELFNPGFVRERHTPLLSRLNFPIGQQNIEVKGVFGYTDPPPVVNAYTGDSSEDQARELNLSVQGVTPLMINHVTKLLVMKELAKMQKTAARFDARNRYRLTSERTRDQAYNLEGLGARAGALFTGDPEIDNVLSYFMRPPSMGAA